MVIEILLGISVVANLVLLYGVRNLLRQNEQLEDNLSDLVVDTNQTISSAVEQMKQVDIRGSFESDDEVGTVFTELKGIV